MIWLLILQILSNALIAPDGCKKSPAFVSKLGFNVSNIAYSTSEKKKKGVFLIDITNGKSYQHNTWKKFGTLGPVVLDEAGNAYTVPVPFVNILENKPNDQNKILWIDTNTGLMDVFLDIPHQKIKQEQNPYGLLGIAYDCDTKCIYTSSVANSTRDKESGKIYAINKESKKIVDSIIGLDCIGLYVLEINKERILLLGNARKSEIYSVKLDNSGRFLSKPKQEISLVGLGPRGDDIARKIRFVNGNLVVYGIEFNFNLIAPTEKQENIYNFKFDKITNSWVFEKYGN